MEIDSPYPQDHVSLLRDLESWQARNANRISLNGKSITEEGRLVLNLAINDTKFRLICPSDYPYHDEVFFLETECTDFWFVALNEFVIDYPERLTLDVVLEKTFLYYTPSSSSYYSRDEYLDEISETDSDSENEEDSESSEINDREYIFNLKKREWKRKEGELRIIYNRPKISDMFDGINTAVNGDEDRQIFSNSAASLVLVNDLINIMERGKSDGVLVEPIENDIFRWSVKLKNFTPGSNIFKDFSKFKEIYGYDFIDIELYFPMDLYPFHPPILKVIGPKLIGVFDDEVFVKFFNWNPARDMASVLKDIKNFIEKNANIDIHHRINGVNLIRLNETLKDLTDTIVSHYESEKISMSYEGKDDSIFQTRDKYYRNRSELFVNPSIEKIFKKLLKNLKITDGNENFKASPRNAAEDAMQTEIIHRSYFNFYLSSDVNETFNSANNNNQSDNNKTSKNVNITTNPSFEFDFKSSNEFKDVLFDNLFYDSSKKFGAPDFRRSKINDKSIVRCVNDDLISTFGYGKIKNSEGSGFLSEKKKSSGFRKDNSYSVLKVLKESTELLALIRSKMADDAFFEIWLTPDLHSIIIDIIIEIARDECTIDFLNFKTDEDSHQSIADMVKIQGENVGFIYSIFSSITTDVNHSAAVKKDADISKMELAKKIISTSKFVESKLIDLKILSKGEENNSVMSIDDDDDNDDYSFNRMTKKRKSIYRNCMKELQFRNCNIDPENHAFNKEYESDIDEPRNYFQIAQELAFISKILSLKSPNPTIFVVMDSSKCSLMRALIIGADGTYGSGGCFTYDIYMKKTYPNCPIGIISTTFSPTTDKSTSPSDDNAERIFLPFELSEKYHVDELDHYYSPKHQFSTIFQALIYVQKRKFPPELTADKNYRQNCRNLKNEAEHNPDNILITNIIKYSMIDKMRKPSPGFEEVIKTHFRLNRDRILSELINKHEFLKNSDTLRSLIEEFDNLQKTD